MERESIKNRTIVRNTIYLYIRTFLTMLITLYTSRVVLKVLGFDDYGAYNVVGGIAASFTFLSSMLSNATQRYLNIAIGEDDMVKANHVFNMNMLIYIAYSMASVAIVEVGGWWFIENKMVISPDRVGAVCWCLHATSVMLFMSLVSSVYESVLIARENMRIYAYMGIYDAVSKLVIIFLVAILTVDKLKLYAVLVTFTHVSARMIPIVYTVAHYAETRLVYYWDRTNFKEMSRFIGWDFMGTIVFILNDQGVNILLNLFFGPAVNAARAISVQVKNSISNFAMGFFTAVRPQIVKSYASGDMSRFVELVFNSGKFTFFLLWIICLPVMVRVDDILSVWLGSVPEWTGQFIVWILIFNLVNCSLCDPMWQGIQAIGRLGRYVLVGSIIYMLAFPVTWILFVMKGSPLLSFQVLVAMRLVYFFVTARIFRDYTGFSFRDYTVAVIVPIVKVVIVSAVLAVMVDRLLPDNLLFTIVSCMLTVAVVALSVFFFGMKSTERAAFMETIRKKIFKKMIVL